MSEHITEIYDPRALIACLPTAVYVCEAPSGIIRLYNRRAVELWGREPKLDDTDERFCGSFRLYRPDGRFLPHADTPMAEVLRHGGERDEDVIIERPDGSRVMVRVNITALRDSQGRITGAVNVFQDIAARVRAEEDAARFAAIVASADDVIVSKSLDGRIMSWNRAAEKLFGYSEAEAVGQMITLIIPPERLHEEREILHRLTRGEAVANFETERVAKDGRKISISLTVSPVWDRNGRVIGASKVARDITERKRLERERDELHVRERTARAAAQAANQAKDEFLAMLAHELRNPVGVIVNALGLLEGDRDANPTLGRVLGVIGRQTGHLARLLDDLLDVARITGGRIELERRSVDVRSVAEQVLESQRDHIAARRQQVTLSLGDDPVRVVGDPIRLHQVVGNLLNNACKYTPAGGSIWITLCAEDDEAVLRVRDDGAGIPTDKLESVFDLFVQANPTLARTEGGLGVGLTLVKRLVELHGGRVHARSQGPGQGAEFVVRLPLDHGAIVSSPRRPAPPAAASRRILVVEDNNDGREMLATMLRLRGHEVFEAATGGEGLAMALQHAPAIVLLDIGLPDVDGYEIGRQLRHRLDGGARLVALTGYGQPQDRARSEKAGFDAHLVKPVDPAKLVEVLQQLK